MANVNISTDVSFYASDEEKEILTRARDILENLRHDWYMDDDNAWDDERYWELENTVKFLEKNFGLGKKE